MKRTIAEAFLTLARQKAVDKITVKDLVEECHISRQTFYYHFQDLLEVLEWTFQQMTQQTLERSLRADTPQAALRAFFEGAMEHRDLIDKLLHSQKWEQTQGLIVQTIHSYLEELFRAAPPESQAVLCRFGGHAGILYLRNGRSSAEAPRAKRSGVGPAGRSGLPADDPARWPGRVEPAGSGRSPDIGLAPYSVPNLGKIARFFPFSAGCGVSKAMV